jgi:Family of unknown function (DUF6074)
MRALRSPSSEAEPSGRPPPPPIGDAVVVPFPFAKRSAYIERQLSNVAGYNPDAAKRYLDARLDDARRRMRNAGIAEHLIDADLAPVEQIFRDRLRLMFGRGVRRYE